MSDAPPSDDRLVVLLAQAEQGDAGAKEAVFVALYSELHRLAKAHVHRAGNVTLSATTLLHEAYIDFARRDGLAFPDRNRFMGYASRAMRGLVIDYIRERRADKRGGGMMFTTFDEERVAPGGLDFDALGLALDELAVLDPALAEIVDLKFFCGFSFQEIAALRGVSDRTIQRDWAKARGLLHRFLSEA